METPDLTDAEIAEIVDWQLKRGEGPWAGHPKAVHKTCKICRDGIPADAELCPGCWYE